MRAKNPTDTARKESAEARKESAEALKKSTEALASAISKSESHTEMTAVAVQAHT